MILCLFMTGCRMNKESKVSRSRVYADEIGMVLRRVDSLSGTISEKRYLTIDFYPPTDDLSTGNPIPAAPSAIFSSAAQGGGFGAVKSVSIASVTEASAHGKEISDSQVVTLTAEADDRQRETGSEVKQDYSIAVSCAIVLALSFMLFMLTKTKTL